MSYQADIKLIQSFKPEDYSEMERVFKAFDTNKNGVMEREVFRRFDVVEPRYSRDYLSSSLFQQLGKLLETLS